MDATLRELVTRHRDLERDIAELANAVENANREGDFESGIEIIGVELEKEHELEIVKQRIWSELRKGIE